MICLSMALKNIKANRKRTLITILLCTFSTGLLVFSSAWMDGSHDQMIRNALEIYPGYVQITQRDFPDTPSYDNLIFNLAEVEEKLHGNPDIGAYGSRFETFVLFAADEKAVGAMLTGIEPDKEKSLSRLASSLRQGEYPQPNGAPGLYLGSELAKKLKVKVGESLSFIGTAADYSFAADTLTVIGIFKTGLFEFDGSAAFMARKYFDPLMGSTGLASHVIVLPTEVDKVAELAAALQGSLGSDYLSRSWLDFMGGLKEAMELDSVFGYITLAIVFIVIFFVIMIYTLLAVLARVREIGIMRGIGVSPAQVFVMLISESAMLSLVSVLLGGVIGGCLAYYFSINPIEFSGYEEQFKQYGMAATAMPAAFEPLTIVRDMVIMFFLSTLSTLYPIIKVNSYTPVEAINHV